MSKLETPVRDPKTQPKAGEPVIVYRPRPVETFSVPSILAVLCALGSFATGAFLGAILAVGAIGFGLLGAGLALSPRRRGGIVSMLSIVGGLLGIVAAAVKLVLLIL